MSGRRARAAPYQNRNPRSTVGEVTRGARRAAKSSAATLKRRLPEARAASSSKLTQKPPHHAPLLDQVHSPVSGSAVMGKRPAESASVRSTRRINSSMTSTCPKMAATEHDAVHHPAFGVNKQANQLPSGLGNAPVRDGVNVVECRVKTEMAFELTPEFAARRTSGDQPMRHGYHEQERRCLTVRHHQPR